MFLHFFFAGSLLLAASLVAGPAAAQGGPNSIVTSAGRCLVPQADRPGAELRTGACEGSAPLRVDAAGTVRTPAGACLDWTNEGGPVHLAECRATRANQRWKIEKNGLIRSASRQDLCMDVEGGKPADGTRVLAWQCQSLTEPARNQRFRVGTGSAASAPDDAALAVLIPPVEIGAPLPR